MRKFIPFMLALVFLLGLTGCMKSAERAEERNFLIEGEKYIAVSIGYTEEGKTIAKAGGYAIMEIPEDKDHIFLAVRSGLDNWTIVKESYVIPTSGKLNVAYCNHERIADGEKLQMVQSILGKDYQGSFVIKTKDEFDIYNATKDLYVGYEDCPVGTDRIGSIGNINGYLVFIAAEDMKDADLQYTCYILHEEYQDLYANSVQGTFETAN
jgi:hypothetical protein